MKNKLLLFDADETIWHSINHDYISSQKSDLSLINSNTIQRNIDNNNFYLSTDIQALFKLICKKGHKIGIVSDNNKPMVLKALKLFGLWPYITKQAINVRLWKGYCPKEIMVTEIINKLKIYDNSNIYWFDDKDYQEAAKSINVNFTQINQNYTIDKAVLSIL